MYSNLQGITKGSAFRLYFSSIDPSSGSRHRMTYNEVTATIKLSKDGGAIATASNSAVFIGTASDQCASMFYVDLTANEMNANIISVNITFSASTAQAQSIQIYTGSIETSGGATAQQIWEYVTRTITGGGTTVQSPAVMTSICDAVNDGYSVASIATGESGYNYYGLTNPESVWWIIIRESTDFTSVGYKMKNQNAQSYADGWSARATQIYGDTFPLK